MKNEIAHLSTHGKTAGFDYFNETFNFVFTNRLITLTNDAPDFISQFSSWIRLVGISSRYKLTP